MSDQDDAEALADILAHRWVDSRAYGEAVKAISELNRAASGDEPKSKVGKRKGPKTQTPQNHQAATTSASQPPPGGLFAAEGMSTRGA